MMMENKSFIPDSIPADLDKSWHIPRPTLARSSQSSQGSTSSNNSTQSARSGSLLLTAANLAQIHHQHSNLDEDDNDIIVSTRNQNLRYYLQQSGGGNGDGDLPPLPRTGDIKKSDPDTVSVASSMHFTVVNVNTRQKPPQRSFCRKHQLTILVVSMSVLFTIGILTAILFLELRANNQRY